MHRVAISGRDKYGQLAIESLGLNVRPAKAGSDSWRYESCFKDYGQAMRVAEEIRGLIDVQIKETARFGRGRGSSLPMQPASAVRPGMAMFTERGDFDVVESVERIDRSEEHTSELQSRQYLVCRLLLEKKTHRKAESLSAREDGIVERARDSRRDQRRDRRGFDARPVGGLPRPAR